MRARLFSWDLRSSGPARIARLLTIVSSLATAAILASCGKDGDGVVAPPPGSFPPGWSMQAPLPGVTTFTAVATPDAQTVVGVGPGGYVARKVGTGAWEIQSSGTSENLLDVSFSSPDAGVAVGAKGAAVRTTDGGRTWSPLTLPVGATLHGVQLLDAQRFTIVGDDGTILRTTNGGAAWTDRSVAATQSVRGVNFLDASRGFVAGGDEDSASILYTDDGGATWERQCCDGGSRLERITFHDDMLGLAVGSGSRRITRDGGTTWLNLAIDDVTGLGDAAFANENQMTVVGSGGSSHQSYSYSEDGGMVWIQPGTPVLRHATNTVSFASGGVGWSAGALGTVLRSDDGGATWEWGSNIPRESLVDVFFVDADRGWFVGSPGIFRTIDGGATWTRQRAPGTGGASLKALWFTSPTIGFAVGVGSEPMVKTTDGGLNWSVTSPTNQGIYDIFFLDASRGWFVGPNNIHVTVDGGATWEEQDDGVAVFHEWSAVHFVDANHGWAAGSEGRIVRTTDGGENWESMPSLAGATLLDVRFRDASEGWLVGGQSGNGVILHTTDGGASWTPQYEVAGHACRAIRLLGNEAWVVGADFGQGGTAIILHSADGGATWTEQTEGRHPFSLNGLAPAGSGVVTAVGDFGLILRTENGGAPE